MKALSLLAALGLSGAAFAQESVPVPAPPPDSGVTQQGTVPSGEAVAPPGTNEPPITVPEGAPMPDQQAAFTPQPASIPYPPCSRTVTDRCVQTYERPKGR